MPEHTIENPEYYHLIKLKVFEKQLRDIFQSAEREKFEIITIKGWSVARLYRPPHIRLFGDIDICVNPEHFERAKTLLQGTGNIAFHKGPRNLDSLEWDELYANSKLIETEDIPIRVMADEDHLRILAVHWLTDSGAYKERLRDFYFLLKDNKNFDWEKCLGAVSRTRQKWIVCTLGLAEIHTELDLSETPLADARKQIPQWLFKALEKEWTSGVYLQDMGSFLRGDKKRFWEQLKKRIPPNPILATIDMEGEFDERTRIFYQIGDLFLRAKQSLKKRFKK